MAFFSIFRHKPALTQQVTYTEPELKLCKHCKHHRNRCCYNPNYILRVDLVDGVTEGEWCAVLRGDYGECGIEAHGWEPR